MRSVGARRLVDPAAWLSILVAGAQPATAFAPPLDRPIVYTLTEDRPGGAGERRFAARRQITFRATATGFDAELRMLDAHADADDGAAAMFMRAMVDLNGRTIRYRLDPRGRIVAIDDQTALWDAVCKAIEAMGSATPVARHARAQNTYLLAQTLRRLPADQVAAMLGSLLTAMIADPDAVADNRVVTVPAAAPDGTTAKLAGIERVTTDNNIATTTLDADGDAGGTAFTTTAPAPRLSYHLRRTVDLATGLLVDLREERDVVTGTDPAKKQLVVRLIITRE